MDTTLLDSLYNDLINLDEQAGCFDEDTNAQIDLQRSKVMKQIQDLENFVAYKKAKYLNGV